MYTTNIFVFYVNKTFMKMNKLATRKRCSPSASSPGNKPTLDTILSCLAFFEHSDVKASFIQASLSVLVSSYRELFKTFGIKLSIQDKRGLLYWYNSSDEVSFIKMLKYEIASPIAVFMKNSKPERPNYHFILGNGMIRYIKKITFRMSRIKAASLCFGINNLKRVFPPLPASYRKAMEEKHKATIEKTPIKLPKYILKKIDRIVDEIFPPGWDRTYEPDFSFTGSSCLQNSRAKGGHLEYWRDQLQSRLGQMTPVVITDPDGESKLLGLDTFHFDRVNEFNYQARYRAKAECIEDPLKIRIITKNDANFSLLKGVQRCMWKHLQKFPAFIFTGTPAHGAYFKEIFSTLNISKEKSFFISGDYSAATDNLPPDGSNAILERVMQNARSLPLHVCKIALESLTYHEVEYNYIEPAIQNNGQMMGSLLSFPVLCLYNIALYQIALEKFLKTKLLASWVAKRVLINGDDILFVANRTFYKIWWDLVTSCGLEPSMGKNFSNPEFFTINSMLFKWSYKNKCAYNICFPKIQYFYNLHRTVLDKQTGNLKNSNLPSLLAGLQNDQEDYQIQPFSLESFMKRLIAKDGRFYQVHDFRNLWLPRHEGGHGLKRLTGTIVRLNSEQRRYKRLIKKNGRLVSEYLSIKIVYSDKIQKPRSIVHPWHERFTDYVRSEREQEIENERLRVESVEKALRPLRKFRYDTVRVPQRRQLKLLR